MPRPDARGLVALSTFATVAFVAPPAAPTPMAAGTHGRFDQQRKHSGATVFAPRMRLPLACLTRQSFLMCLLLSGHHITTPPARNERSNRGACSPRTLDSRRSLDAHESPAVAGCPSCLAQTYASFLAHAHCSRLATAHGCAVADHHGALVECGVCGVM